MEISASPGTRSATIAPRGDLAPFVASHEFDASGAFGQESRVLQPDGQVFLACQLTPPVNGAGALPSVAGAFVVGPRTYAKAVPNPQVVFVVRFHPGGAFPFLGLPMHELENRAIPLADLWGTDGIELDERLAGIAVHDNPEPAEHMLGVVEQALLARMRRPEFAHSARAITAQHAVQAMIAAPEIPNLQAIATEVGISERQLRRVFAEAVGLGPKAYAQVIRFQRAMRAVEQTGMAPWAAIALEAGYYDQSHMIADFRRFTGGTPSAYVAASRGLQSKPPSDRFLACRAGSDGGRQRRSY